MDHGLGQAGQASGSHLRAQAEACTEGGGLAGTREGASLARREYAEASLVNMDEAEARVLSLAI